MTDPQFVYPTEALQQGSEGGAVLQDSDVTQWREKGFALVSGVFPSEAVSDVSEKGRGIYASADLSGIRDFGSGGKLEFPTGETACDSFTLHPRLLKAVSQLLGTEDLRLTQSDVWLKVGREGEEGGPKDNQNQRIHVDFPNHTLVVPPHWTSPEAVEMIVYFDKAEETGGGTAVVPREGPEDPAYAEGCYQHNCGFGPLQYVNNLTAAEAYLETESPDAARFRKEHLYPREKRVSFVPGTVLFYRHDTWHRGTPVRQGQTRLVMNLTFCRADSVFCVLQKGWSWSMYKPDLYFEKTVAGLSTWQRTALGFPPPGHPYWNAYTLMMVRKRYGPLGMNMDDYEQGVKKGKDGKRCTANGHA
uniref:Uncharacterized protein n=1 Tax=Chromera velia CCMP2878 TaxID=1169474 RepID=A0A0G4HX87_9ALVE|eukprot:Cvel_9217.t1-p1 / transcript=Cvel_9217.t1 / gene=Cvel_9217 / organism=Chromera_velia_CCMP2878 / gene_product=hypothetical protein / transcript_product=hypothetical protein / location=Cvel_scaffold525:54130-55206(-) / protein_length=359 / sequence_SO=supercontig / SO=protein_coding / is_pseudo=false